jgi:MFS family permease
MRAFWWDGFWANVPETVLISYLGLYVIAFGGSNAQVGLIAALGSLAAALAFFPGAKFVETVGHRKRVVLATGGGLGRIVLLGLVLVPFIADGDVAIWLVIALIAARGFFGYFAIPAWTSLTADIVPIEIRGRFFASRNFGMSLAALVTAPAAGLILDRYSGLGGWQIVWLICFGAAAVSTWCYAQIPDPAPHADVRPAGRAAGQRGIVADILSDRSFAMYLLGTGVWNVGLHAAGPFFNVYLARNLDASAAFIGFLTALPAVSGLVGLVYFGRVMDQRGTKWLMVVCGLLIPALPAAWLAVSDAWQVIFINLPGGVIWAGYQLAMLNMVMVMAPPEKRARYAAAFQTVTFAGAFVGPLLGGQVISALGFKAVFALSAIGRMAGTLIVWRFVDATPREHAA